jgi:hypothetical protein
VESTAQGAHGCFYEEWMGAEANGWVRHFFPWWWEASYAVFTNPECSRQPRGAASLDGKAALDGISADGPFAKTARRLDAGEDAESEEERGLVSKHGLTREQIAFRRRLQRQFGVLARQEYPESADDCFLASGSCVFDTEVIDRRLREAPAPVERRWAGTLEVWLKPIPGREYLVAVDPSGGGSEGDYAAMQVLDAATGLQCAEFQGRCGLLEIAERAATIGRDYNGATLIVERNNHGAGVLAYLTGVVQYARLYEQDGQPGWLTTALSRPRAVGQVERLLGEGAESVMSARLLREMKTFVRDARGRTGAAQGQHDDLVMAMGIALAVRADAPAAGLAVRAIAPAARDAGFASAARSHI